MKVKNQKFLKIIIQWFFILVYILSLYLITSFITHSAKDVQYIVVIGLIPYITLTTVFFIRYFYIRKKNFSKKRLKYFFIVDPFNVVENEINNNAKIKEERTENKIKMEEELQRKKVEELELLLIKKESDRTSIEKYSSKEIYLGLLIPLFSPFGYFIFAIYEYVVYKTHNFWMIVSFIILLIASFTCEFIRNEWEVKLKRKDNDDAYKNDYIYSDSIIEYYVYLISKLICYTANILVVIIIGLLLYSYFQNTYIPPNKNNIIIGLLIFIIVLLVSNRPEK
jgi:hypothetical protein